MNKYSYLCIIILAACLSEIEIACRTTCIYDGDESYYVKGETCFCSNSRDISRVYVKVPKQGSAIIDKKKTVNWISGTYE